MPGDYNLRCQKSSSSLHFSHQKRTWLLQGFPRMAIKRQVISTPGVNADKYKLKRRQQLSVFFCVPFTFYISCCFLLLFVVGGGGAFFGEIFLFFEKLFPFCPSFPFKREVSLWIPLKGHNILAYPFLCSVWRPKQEWKIRIWIKVFRLYRCRGKRHRIDVICLCCWMRMWRVFFVRFLI